MPKLSNLVGRHGELRIPVPDDEDFVVKFSRPRVTPDLLLQVSSLQLTKEVTPEALATVYDLATSVIISWNLEDEDGPIPVTAAALRDRVDLMILMDLIQRIAETFKADPRKGGDSDAG